MLNENSEGVNHSDGKTETALVIWENLERRPEEKGKSWAEVARRVARHEGKGHLRLRQVLGKAYASWMRGVVRRDDALP